MKFAINSDAHSTVHVGFMRYGVGMAQRGWLAADDVVNTVAAAPPRSHLARHRPTQLLTGGSRSMPR